jgi:hypothetical protein
MSVLVNEMFTMLGGVGVIVLGFFAYLKQIQLTRYGSQLTETRDKLNKLLESEVHAKKAIFDKEFSIYEKLWDLIVELERETHEMLTLIECCNETEDGLKAKREFKIHYIKFYENAYYQIRKWAPFIPADTFELIVRKFGSFKWTVQTVEVQNDDEEYIKFLDGSIKEIREEISLKIKTYIKNI